VTGAIHLDLYLTGYRSIPVIGWLFLLQVIAAFGLAAAVLVSGSRLAGAAGAGFALSTLAGYLLSVWIGLFGFKEIRTTAGIVAGVIEVAAFAIGGMTVLNNAKAFTLYSFAPDTPTRSNCNGTCAAYWPPVTGTPAAGPGVTGKLGTIKRSDGATQATYDGHPLYTYIADIAPGQAHGQ
jgi:predicted lipoprotein with Yx(FWY)xxD motif